MIPVAPQSVSTIWDIHTGNLQEVLYLAHCSKLLGALYRKAEKYEDAEKSLASAMEAYERIGHYDTEARRGLSRVLILKGDHQGALRLLMQALKQSKSHGNPADIARTLGDLGRCWMKLGNKEDARGAFEESRRYFSSFHTKHGDRWVVLCDFFLKRLEDPLVIPSNREKRAWLANYAEDA